MRTHGGVLALPAEKAMLCRERGMVFYSDLKEHLMLVRGGTVNLKQVLAQRFVLLFQLSINSWHDYSQISLKQCFPES